MISTPASTALWPATAQWRPGGGEQQAADGGGIDGLEGSTHGHDVIPVDLAIAHLEKRGLDAAATVLKGIIKSVHSATLLGSGQRLEANRNVFGDAVVELLAAMPQPVRKDNVLLVDSDLEGSCGLAQIRKAYPEIFVRGGIMERANFSAAAGFGMEAGRR